LVPGIERSGRIANPGVRPKKNSFESLREAAGIPSERGWNPDRGRLHPTVERCRPVPFPSVKMGVPGETVAGERRVALVPETAAKLIAAGLECSIEAGAGAAAGFRDDAYREAGVELATEKAALLSVA